MRPKPPPPFPARSAPAVRGMKHVAAAGPAAVLAIAAAACGGSGDRSSRSTPKPKPKPKPKLVRFAQTQAVFVKYHCAACHPLVNPSVDLRPGREYASLVGVRALEDPRLVRVVAGDPARSFLYQKIAGDPRLGDIPAIGARMP